MISRTDFLPDLPRIFSRSADAFNDGESTFWICDQKKQSAVRIDISGTGTWSKRRHCPKPALLLGKLCGIENEAIRGFEDASRIVGPFEVTAHPIKTVGYS